MSNVLVEVLTSSLGGSILGAVSAIFSKVYEGKQQLSLARLELEKSHADNQHELAMAQLSSAARREEALSAIELVDTAAGYETLQASIESDKATYSSGSGSKWLVFVDVIRGTMRAWLTTALIFYLGIALFYLTSHYDVELEQAEVVALIEQILQCLTTGASLALAWWFGSKTLNRKE